MLRMKYCNTWLSVDIFDRSALSLGSNLGAGVGVPQADSSAPSHFNASNLHLFFNASLCAFEESHEMCKHVFHNHVRR